MQTMTRSNLCTYVLTSMMMRSAAHLSGVNSVLIFFFFSSRRRHTRFDCDWSSDVCSSDLRLRAPRRPQADEQRWKASARSVLFPYGARDESRRGLSGRATILASSSHDSPDRKSVV